ncbi:MAG: methylated-DNA--[protein]-cysteine S-methyltransferase [Acidobacteriota bacterium]
MRCRNVLLRLDQHRTGELENTESTELNRHVETCGSCNDSLHELDRFAELVQLLGSSSPGSCEREKLDRVSTSGGEAWVIFGERGIRMIDRSEISEAELRDQYCVERGIALERSPLPDGLRRQVIDSLQGDGCPSPEVDLSGLGEFERQVLTTIVAIPRGEVRPYAWVAREIGRPRAVRAVGNALNKNPLAPVLPCHRVVPTGGGIGNYALGSPKKMALLRREGVNVEYLERLGQLGVRLIGLGDRGYFCYPTCANVVQSDPAQRVDLRDDRQAAQRGFEPCPRCRPVAMSA